MKHLSSLRLLSFSFKATAITCQLLGLPCAARAQVVKQDKLAQAKDYTQVEQMPQLPKANRKYTDREAVVAAIQRACRYPAEAMRNRVQGTVLVGFTGSHKGRCGTYGSRKACPPTWTKPPWRR